MTNYVRDRVEIILQSRPLSRGNDLILRAKYMNMFYDIGLTTSQVEKMLKAKVSYGSIIRERSRFQNTLKKYIPDAHVIKTRHQTKNKYRDRYGPMYKEDL